MALSGDCLDKLCGIAVAGGIVAAGASGASVPTGVLELLTTGSHLARAVRGGQETQCRAYVARVRKAIEKDYGVWLARECGNDWSMKADVQAALFELDRILLRLRPNAEDIVEAGQNGDKLVRLLIGRLPATSLFRTNDTAKRVFESLIKGTFALVRSDSAFSAELTSFSFERVHEALDEIGATTKRTEGKVDTLARDQAASFAQTATSIAEIKAMLAAEFERERGIDPAYLKPLFEAVGHDPNILPARYEEAVRAAVETLLARAHDPIQPSNEGEAVDHALEAARAKLAQLDTQGAVEHLRKERTRLEEERLARAQGEARLAVEEGDILRFAYRHKEAIAAYEQAAQLDPSSVYALVMLGDIHQKVGRLGAALEAYTRAADSAKRSGQERDLAMSYQRIGDVRVAQGDLAGAAEAYAVGLAIAQKLADADPGNAEWQRDLSVSYQRIGDVRVAQSDLAGAVEAYEADLAIAQKLAAADLDNVEWQRDLSISHDRIGDVRLAQGNLAGALQAYETSLEIREKFAAADPDNTGWQHDLSVSHNKIGDVRRAQGDLTGALQAYEADLAIARKLAAADPDNAEWQRDLVISYIKLAGAGKDPHANYGQALAIARRLAEAGRLAPRDVGMIEDLERRIAALDG